MSVGDLTQEDKMEIAEELAKNKGLLTTDGKPNETAIAMVEAYAAIFDEKTAASIDEGHRKLVAKAEGIKNRIRASRYGEELKKHSDAMMQDPAFAAEWAKYKNASPQPPNVANSAYFERFIEAQAKNADAPLHAKAKEAMAGLAKVRRDNTDARITKEALKRSLGITSTETWIDPEEVTQALGGAVQGAMPSIGDLFTGGLSGIGSRIWGAVQGAFWKVISSLKPIKDWTATLGGTALNAFKGNGWNWDAASEKVKINDVNEGMAVLLGVKDKDEKKEVMSMMEEEVERHRKLIRDRNRGTSAPSGTTSSPADLQVRTSVPQHEGTEPVSVPIDVPVSPLETPPGNPALQRIVNPAVAHS